MGTGEVSNGTRRRICVIVIVAAGFGGPACSADHLAARTTLIFMSAGVAPESDLKVFFPI